MAEKKLKGRSDASAQQRYMVVTVSELDQYVYEVLHREGAAKKHPDDPTQYIISDKEKARSQIIMPKVLSRFGRKGWNLTAINNMECFIFERTENNRPVEYSVFSPSDLDRMSLKVLQDQNQLSVEIDENSEQTVHVKDASSAKIQLILPKVLEQITQDGWKLCAVSGPQLYFFSRPA